MPRGNDILFGNVINMLAIGERDAAPPNVLGAAFLTQLFTLT